MMALPALFSQPDPDAKENCTEPFKGIKNYTGMLLHGCILFLLPDLLLIFTETKNSGNEMFFPPDVPICHGSHDSSFLLVTIGKYR
jgi:hypothetical protein